MDQKESHIVANSSLHINNAYSSLNTHGVNSALNTLGSKPDLIQLGVISSLHNHGAISALHINDEALKVKKRSQLIGEREIKNIITRNQS